MKMKEGMRVWISYTNQWKNHPRADQSDYWEDAKPLSLSKTIAAVALRSDIKKSDSQIEFNPQKAKVLPEPPGKTPLVAEDRVLATDRGNPARLEDAVRHRRREAGDRGREMLRADARQGQEAGRLRYERRIFASLPAEAQQGRRPEIFLSLLMRLAPALVLEKYHYVGLGGPFLEDFRLVHARLGLARMTCVETEEEVHKRQLFNRPVASIECVHETLENYLDGIDFETPAIIWFDYTEPKGITTQIERFARTIGSVPIGSVLRVTLNANPGVPSGSRMPMKSLSRSTVRPRAIAKKSQPYRNGDLLVSRSGLDSSSRAVCPLRV